MKLLRIGLAQCRQYSSLEPNAETILRFLEKAGRAGVQILCFPECQTAGYRVGITPPETPVQPQRLEELHGEVARRCAAQHMACILGTETPLEEDPVRSKPYNSALVISPEGNVLVRHHKTKLTPLDATRYTPGNSIETFDVLGIRIGVVICYEGFRFPATTAECVRQGAQVVFHPQNNTTRPDDWKIPIHHAMIVTRAAENTIWFASANICHDRHQNCRSMVVAPDGRIQAQTELKREELLVADIDVDLATRAMFRQDPEGCERVLSSHAGARERLSA